MDQLQSVTENFGDFIQGIAVSQFRYYIHMHHHLCLIICKVVYHSLMLWSFWNALLHTCWTWTSIFISLSNIAIIVFTLSTATIIKFPIFIYLVIDLVWRDSLVPNIISSVFLPLSFSLLVCIQIRTAISVECPGWYTDWRGSHLSIRYLVSMQSVYTHL